MSTNSAPYRRLIAITTAAEKKEDITQLEESRQQPVWHVIVLHILTLSAYSPFWFAKNWALLIHAAKTSNSEEEADEKLVSFNGGDELAGVRRKDPILLTIGMFIPFLNLYLAFELFKLIASLQTKNDKFPAKHPKVTAGLLLLAMFLLYLLGYLPSTLYLLCLSSFAPLALAQHWLNLYWRRSEPTGAPIRFAFSTLELMSIVLGSLLLGLLVITPFVVR